ncbi:MAG: hypothetical protein RMJ98_01320 [Myxococcales bacterium]|nr:hypothetical protein [Polyangiaceae bacterium]MDW8247927.1 hypothetical protein [Myxococcales bacterium]
MSSFRDAIDSMDENSLWAVVACAIAVGKADGRMETNETQELVKCLSSLGCDRCASSEIITSVMAQVDGMSPNEVVDWASEYVGDESIGGACLVIASAVAAKTGGIGTKEGAVLQYIANAVGIGYPGNRYTQLISEGMQLARS